MSLPPDTTIRWARPEDAGCIINLIKRLAAYESEPQTSIKITETDIHRDGFSEPKRFECLIAELDEEVAGFALFFHNYSTWMGKPGIYLEDLYVDEKARGSGLGKNLMAALAKLAQERGCERLELSVLDWNPTRNFYHAIDCNHMKTWLPYRMESTAITALAAKAPDIAN